MSIEPAGEEIRKATRWISEERQSDPGKPLKDLIEEASIRFDLSPLDADFLFRTLGDKK